MLKISKIMDVNLLIPIADKFKFELSDDDLYITATIDEVVQEFLCYSIKDKSVIIKFITDNTNDFQLILGIVKTLLFTSDVCKLEKIVLPLKYKRIATALGFVQKENCFTLLLSEYKKQC